MWVDYAKVLAGQQAVFRNVNPQLAPRYDHYRVWITRNKCVSRRKGHWSWTEAYAKEVDEAARAVMRGDAGPSKDDRRRYKTGEFHLDRR